MSEETKLLPCPFCGKSEPSVGSVIGTGHRLGEKFVVARIECVCGAHGPQTEGARALPANAAKAWNTRAAPSPPVVGREEIEPEELEELIADRSANRAADAILKNYIVLPRALPPEKAPAPGAVVEIRREWLAHVISCLQGPLPSGHIGDAVFLLRDQLQDILDRPPSPPPAGERRCGALTAEVLMGWAKARWNFEPDEFDAIELVMKDILERFHILSSPPSAGREEVIEECARKVEELAGHAGGFIAAEIRALSAKPAKPAKEEKS